MAETGREIATMDRVHEKDTVTFGIVLVGLEHYVVEIEKEVGLVLFEKKRFFRKNENL